MDQTRTFEEKKNESRTGIRVPAEHYDEFVAALDAGDTFVITDGERRTVLHRLEKVQ